MNLGISGVLIGQIIGRILGHNAIFAVLIAIDCLRAKQNKKNIGLFIVGIVWQALLSYFYISARERVWNGENIWYLHVSSVVVGIIGYCLLYKIRKESAQKISADKRTAASNTSIPATYSYTVFPKESIKFCRNCGAKIAPNAKFCSNCGYNIGEITYKPDSGFSERTNS